MRLSNSNDYIVQLAVEDALGGYSVTFPQNVTVNSFSETISINASIHLSYLNGTYGYYSNTNNSLSEILGQTIEHVITIDIQCEASSPSAQKVIQIASNFENWGNVSTYDDCYTIENQKTITNTFGGAARIFSSGFSGDLVIEDLSFYLDGGGAIN